MSKRVGQAGASREADLAALARRAAAFARAGRHAEAVASWEAGNRRHPGSPAAAAGLGLALLAMGRNADALVWLCSACGNHPRDAGLLRLQAQALLAAGLRRQAIGALYMALDLEPNAVSTHAGLGIALFGEGDAAAAIPHCRRAFQLAPTVANAATLSCVAIDLGAFEEALAVTQISVQRSDENAFKVPLNRSIALQAFGRTSEAILAARAAVKAAPANAVARHHLAATLLGAGELTAEAWGQYEARSGLPGAPAWPDPALRWTGSDPAGATILLQSEQGLGDTLQFVRYAPMVAASGARVVLAVQKPLLRLLQGMPGVERVVAAGEDLPAFDLYCPLLSLPGLFATSLETIPPALPYTVDLQPAPRTDGHMHVGLVWAGSSTFADDRKRSIAPSALRALEGVPGVQWHNLQLGATTLPFAGMIDRMAEMADFADTARAIAGLDLVIAADTAVAHLAATMGKPVWLLSRFQGCWRWLQNRPDTPWYPSMRIYGQRTQNDWAGVIARVRDDVGALAAAATPMAA